MCAVPTPVLMPLLHLLVGRNNNAHVCIIIKPKPYPNPKP
jgi:hypothetical protein